MTVTLYAYQYSVYSWIARLVLHEKSVGYNIVEVDPFAPSIDREYLETHPFRRVPALEHDGFTLYETTAITRYIDEAFPGAALQPAGVRDKARQAQIIAVIDAYGYWPMVRQVFSHGHFRPLTGRSADPAEVAQGLTASEVVLAALETLAGGGDYLAGGRLGLVDLHLAPMMAYFTAVEEGRAILSRHPKLSAWWAAFQPRPSMSATRPRFPD